MATEAAQIGVNALTERLRSPSRNRGLHLLFERLRFSRAGREYAGPGNHKDSESSSHAESVDARTETCATCFARFTIFEPRASARRHFLHWSMLAEGRCLRRRRLARRLTHTALDRVVPTRRRFCLDRFAVLL